jgi:CelD/BcsL family acetyltransferase involved in cellulose biosynthesis
LNIDLSSEKNWLIVSDISTLREIRRDWQKLFRSNPRHSPFQSWSWLVSWLTHLAGPAQLRIICALDDRGELCFALPLVATTVGKTTGFSEYSIACGYGPECSDHVGPLSRPGMDDSLPEITALALERFIADKSRVTLTSLDDVDNFVNRLFSQVSRGRRTVRLNRYQRCPVVTLPETWDSFGKKLSRNFSSQIRRYQRRIDRHALIETRPVESADAVHFTEELIRLNRARIADKGQVSSLSDPRFRAFLLEAVPMMATEGLAWMDVLADGGTVAAAALDLVHADRVYYYLGGFDSHYANLRPGVALFAAVIQRSIERGYKSYDFLRGTEPYKYQWGCKDRSTWRLDIYPQTVVSGSLLAMKDDIANRWRETTRHLKNRRQNHER